MFPSLYSARFQPRLYRPGGVGNWSGHLPFAADLVEAVRPARIVELGTHFGESYFGFCQAADELGVSCSAHAIDTWQGDSQTGYYGEAVFEHVDTYNREHYHAFSSLLRMNFDAALPRFDDGSIDLLHLDGLHTYAAVKHDFETWLPKVSPGGIILIHDIAVRESDFGAWQFWEEISRGFPSFSFQHDCGLGVLANRARGDFGSSFLAAVLGGACRADAIRDYYVLHAERLEHAGYATLGPVTACQLFWADAAEFSEANSGAVALPLGQWRSVDFEVPAGAERLRLDPGHFPAFVDIAQIEVVSPASGRVHWCLKPAHLHEVSIQGTAIRIPEEERLLVFSYGRDPQLHLPLLAGAALGPLRVSCRIRIDLTFHGAQLRQEPRAGVPTAQSSR